MKFSYLSVLFLAWALGTQSNIPTCRAADPTADAAPAPATGSKTAKRETFPFRGRIAQVDTSQRTLTLEGKEKQRLIQVPETAKITRDGRAAALTDAVAGDEVGGLLKLDEAGRQTVVSMRLGAKPPAEPKTSRRNNKSEESAAAP